MAFSEKQHEYFRKATARWNIKTGATRSGKTYMDYFVIPKRIRTCTDHGLIVIIGNTQATLERNVFEPMRGIWGDTLVGRVKQNNEINLFGRKCYALGADKQSSVRRLQGAGVQYAYGDEVTTWAEPVFQMLKSRLDKPNSVFDGTCNPDNPEHWFKHFLDSDADIYHQHYTIDDNPFLTPAFVENLKKEYTGTVHYSRYILGEWTRAEGLVYDMFNDEAHTLEEPLDAYMSYYVACDYGTQNPTVFLLIGQASKTEWHIIREYYYDGRATKRQKTDRQYVEDLADFIGDLQVRGVIVDPSAASFMAEMKAQGIRPTPAVNDVLDGIRRNAAQLEQGKLKVVKTCRHTLEELGTYSWDERAADRGEDIPIKESDHAMDAWRYFTNTILYGGRLKSFDKGALGLGRF